MGGIFWEGKLEDNYIGHQMAEIYRDGIYRSLLTPNMTVVDIGANIGITSLYFSNYAKKVFAIEPSIEHFAVLTKMLAFNKVKNVKPIRKAVYLKSGKFPLFHNTNKTMFSLHAAVDDKSSPKEMVDCITLDDLFKEEKIKHVDLMKMDVEGSEAEILSGPGFRKVAPKIDKIILETHQWSGRHPNQILDVLKTNGFEVSRMPSSAEIIVGRK